MSTETVPTVKVCTKCGAEKAHEDFSPDTRKADGRQSSCKTCGAAARVERRKADPLGAQAVARTWESANREKRNAASRDRLNSSGGLVSWRAMIARCSNPKLREYHYYGGRGISVCQRWRESFENFLTDMGPRPSPKHSIDRINNDGNYEPGNCRWATALEQNRNRRPRRRGYKMPNRRRRIA